MKVAICNETFGELPLASALALASEAGYTGWEVAPFTLGLPIDSFAKEDRIRYRNEVESAGLEIIGLHWLLAKTEGFHLTTTEPAVRQRTGQYLVELGELCRDLGGSIMVLGSPQQRNFSPPQTEAIAMENAAEVLKLAANPLRDLGIKIAVEPLGRSEGNFLNTAAKGRELVDMVNHEAIQLHLDVKAMSDETTPVEEIIRQQADVTIHFHANDPNLLGPGMGDVDFTPILKALKEIDYQHWVSVEVFDYSPGVEKILEESMKTLRG